MKITEKYLEYFWLHNTLTDIVTISGDRCSVLYPGRVSSDGGCDFHDAVFSINKMEKHGDIEIHVKNSYWYRHNHHQNPRYNAVSLHVVLYDDNCSLPARLENGSIIPTICLSQLKGFNGINSLKKGVFNCKCPIVSSMDISHLLNLIASAGEEWFRRKAQLFSKEITLHDELQVLYSYCARALGYSKNAQVFQNLANKLPLLFLNPLLQTDVNAAKAAVLGTAGLLPSQRIKGTVHYNDFETSLLELKWKLLGIKEILNENEWCSFRVRPCNAPARRLVALTHLAYKMVATRFIDNCIDTVTKYEGEKTFSQLDDLLLVYRDEYWSNHIDFGRSIKQDLPLIGDKRAGTIIINVILPFIFAYAQQSHNEKLKRKSIQVFRNYSDPEYNQIFRYMKDQLVLSGTALKAVHQQGILHIYKEYCKYRDCKNCIINFHRCEDWATRPG